MTEKKKRKDGAKGPSIETLIKSLSSLKDKSREGARHTLVPIKVLPPNPH